MNWVQINVKVNEDFRYMKIHIPNSKCNFASSGIRHLNLIILLLEFQTIHFAP